MSNTAKQIIRTIELMKQWGMLKDLTKWEEQTLLSELKNIAGTAVMEANNKIQNILPDFYKEITS